MEVFLKQDRSVSKAIHPLGWPGIRGPFAVGLCGPRHRAVVLSFQARLFSLMPISSDSSMKKLRSSTIDIRESMAVSMLFLPIMRYTTARVHPSFLASQLTVRSCRASSSLMFCTIFMIYRCLLPLCVALFALLPAVVRAAVRGVGKRLFAPPSLSLRCLLVLRGALLCVDDNASEGNVGLLTDCRAQLVLCKDTKKMRNKRLNLHVFVIFPSYPALSPCRGAR